MSDETQSSTDLLYLRSCRKFLIIQITKEIFSLVFQCEVVASLLILKSSIGCRSFACGWALWDGQLPASCGGENQRERRGRGRKRLAGARGSQLQNGVGEFVQQIMPCSCRSSTMTDSL